PVHQRRQAQRQDPQGSRAVLADPGGGAAAAGRDRQAGASRLRRQEGPGEEGCGEEGRRRGRRAEEGSGKEGGCKEGPGEEGHEEGGCKEGPGKEGRVPPHGRRRPALLILRSPAQARPARACPFPPPDPADTDGRRESRTADHAPRTTIRAWTTPSTSPRPSTWSGAAA